MEIIPESLFLFFIFIINGVKNGALIKPVYKSAAPPGVRKLHLLASSVEISEVISGGELYVLCRLMWKLCKD